MRSSNQAQCWMYLRVCVAHPGGGEDVASYYRRSLCGVEEFLSYNGWRCSCVRSKNSHDLTWRELFHANFTTSFWGRKITVTLTVGGEIEVCNGGCCCCGPAYCPPTPRRPVGVVIRRVSIVAYRVGVATGVPTRVQIVRVASATVGEHGARLLHPHPRPHLHPHARYGWGRYAGIIGLDWVMMPPRLPQLLACPL